MKNLKAYIYMYVSMQLLLPAFLIAALSWYIDNYYLFGGYVIILIVFLDILVYHLKNYAKKEEIQILCGILYMRENVEK